MAALLIGAAAVVAVVVAFRAPTTGHEAKPGPDEAPEPATLNARIGSTIGVGATAESVASADGSTWVVTYDFVRGSANVVRIDASTGRVVASVPIGGFAYNIAAGNGAVWVPVDVGHGSPSLLRIDAHSNQVTGSVPGVSGPIAVDASGIWAVQGNDIVRIDPASLRIDARIAVERPPYDMAAGGGTIWVLGRSVQGSNTSPGPLMQVDAASATIMRTVDVSVAGIWIAASEDGVWLNAWHPDEPHSSGAFFVPRSGGPPQDVARISNFRPFAVGEGRVWFISGPSDAGLPDGGVCGLDLVTHTVGPCAKPRSIVDLEGAHDALAYDADTQTLWVSEYESSFVTSIGLVSSAQPAKFSFAEAAALLAERKMFVKPIPSDQQKGLLDQGAFNQALQEWMAHHPHWKVLSVHLGDLDAPNPLLNIANRPSYFVEITGPETGNCFYFFDASDGKEFLGACFYPARS